MQNWITNILLMFGISQPPVTVSEFLWDLVLIWLGLYIIKYCIVLFVGVLRDMTKVGF